MSTTPQAIRRTAQDLYSDPEFQKLSPQAQRIVLVQSDADFATLSPAAQSIVMNKLQQPVPLAESPVGRAARGLPALVEDIAYPGMGALAGGIAGASLGPPGVIGGGAIGAVGGETLKQIKRRIMGEGGAPKTLTESIVNALGVAAGGAAQEAGPLLRQLSQAPKAPLPAQKLAMEFGVPMTKAQQTQGGVRSAYESILRRSFGGPGVFREFDEVQNARIGKAADEIADSITTKGLSKQEFGTFVGSKLQAADAAASKIYDEALEVVSRSGASEVPVFVKGPLQQRASELVRQIELPPDFEAGLSNIESRSTAIGILKNFTRAEKVTKDVSPLVTERGEQITRTTVEPIKMTWEQARRLRTQLFQLTNSGELNIGKGALKQLNRELDSAMESALVEAEKLDAAYSFRIASSNYKRVQELLDDSVITRLTRNDRPEVVADILLSRGVGTTAQNLQKLIGPKNMQSVQRALFERIFDKSLREGVLVGNNIERSLEKIGDESLSALFPPEHLGKIRRFAELADTAALRVSKPTSAEGPSLLAFGQSGLAVSSAIQAGKALVQAEPGTFLLYLGGTAAVTLGPRQLARMVTNPKATDVALQLLEVERKSDAAKNLGLRLVTILGMDQAKEQLLRKLEPQEEPAPTPVLGKQRSLLNR